jgi:hypothetical protein
MYPTCCLYDAGRNDFDVGNIHYEGLWKGWALKIETFLGPEMATTEPTEVSAIFGPKKFESTFLGPNGTRFAHCHFRDQESLDFKPHPLPTTLVMDIARIKIISCRAILKVIFI